MNPARKARIPRWLQANPDPYQRPHVERPDLRYHESRQAVPVADEDRVDSGAGHRRGAVNPGAGIPIRPSAGIGLNGIRADLRFRSRSPGVAGEFGDTDILARAFNA